MIYNPLIDLIEQLLKMMKNFASKVYYGWTIISGICLGLGLHYRSVDGYFSELAKILCVVGLMLLVIGWYPIWLYEQKWKKSKKDKID